MSNICEYCVAICTKTQLPCDHKLNMDQCQRAMFAAGEKHLTFADCIRIYKEHSGASPCRIRNIEKSIPKYLGFIGSRVEDHIDSVGYRRFKEMVVKMQALGYSQYTIRTSIDLFKSLGKESLRDNYDDEGFSRPMFDTPKVQVVHKPVVGMTDEQSAKVEEWMWTLKLSKNKIDNECYKALFFERLFAMRPGDINRSKWNILQLEQGRWHLRYLPHKTENKRKECSNIVIPDKIMMLVKPFVGNPDEYILKELEKRPKKPSGIPSHRAIWDRINRRYKELGITDGHKCSYLNRRQRITEAFNKDGYRGACAIGMNTPKIQEKSYIVKGEYEV